MSRKFRPSTRSVGITTHLPPHLVKYVEGLAQIHDQTISRTLADIIKKDFEKYEAHVALKGKSQ